MARNAKKAATAATASAAVEQQQVTVAPAEEPKVEARAAGAGQNITPEIAARFLILDAIKESAASDDLKKQAGAKGKGVYATLTELCAKQPELFVAAWTRVKGDIADNVEGCAVAAGCELSKKTGKYNLPRSASVAASELLYAVGNAIPLVDASTGAVLSFGKIRDANGAHRKAKMLAGASDEVKAILACEETLYAMVSEIAKRKAAIAERAKKGEKVVLSAEFDARQMEAIVDLYATLKDALETFATAKKEE
jgi:hypothetical protein